MGPVLYSGLGKEVNKNVINYMNFMKYADLFFSNSFIQD